MKFLSKESIYSIHSIHGVIISRIPLWLASIILILTLQPAKAQSTQNLREEINEIITYQTINNDLGKLPIHALIIDGDSEFFINTQSQKTDTSYLDSLFCLGGASKIYAGLLLSFWHHENKLLLTDSIKISPNTGTNTFTTTLKSLAIHTSGLPKIPNNLALYQMPGHHPYEYYPVKALDSYIHQSAINNKNEYLYSDLGYAFIEYYLSSRLPKNINLNHYIGPLFPSIFSNTYIHNPAEELVLQGFDRTGRKVGPEKSMIFGLSRTAYTSLRDLKSLADLYFNDYITQNHSWLWYFQEPEYQYHIDEKENFFSSLGWHLLKIDNQFTILIQGGVSEGNSCFIAILPETQTAVFLLSNQPVSLNSLGIKIMRMINRNWSKEKIKREQKKEN